ncbi:Heme-degrading monooxygenase HmoA [Novosphingobium sp. CF614]|uniref:antibiotic biosynthesis monooxygenase n=1 Tax=Novosphingobium sp. CF614 TaxID=1884364 RepID=UPI0008E26816|nr:antibiotic biosynthesis monooxygenase [Novosphingobium sp. CF614]SFG40031.1 Heme-degrading monooxygenase HmoA [Novosphingobium sp. CF614]
MAIVSLTRLKLRRFWFLPAFLRHANASTAQLEGMPGFTGGYLASNWKWTFWTVSHWETREAMRAYRGSGAHAAAMKRLPAWCDEAAVATVEADGLALPSPGEAVRFMEEHGRLTRVDKPSRAQAAKICWPDGRIPRVVRRIVPR